MYLFVSCNVNGLHDQVPLVAVQLQQPLVCKSDQGLSEPTQQELSEGKNEDLEKL